MEELLKLLEEIKPDVDFKENEHLIDDKLLDSLDIVSIVSALNEEFDIKISVRDIIPQNFNSAKAIYDLVQKLQEE